MTDPVIDYILQHDLSEEEKCELKNKRPTPYIQMTLKEKNQKRIFQMSWYHKYGWLTGSIRERKLYCFFCLLFGGEADWTGEGINTIKNLDHRAQRHQQTKLHIRNSELFHMLGKKKEVGQMVSESAHELLCKYNEEVTANRRIVSRLIQAAIYLSSHGLPIVGRGSSGEGYYQDLIKFTAQEEQLMRDHLTNSDEKLTTPQVLKVILQSLKVAVSKRIKGEVAATPFVSIQVDETSDISCKNQISVIFRYCIDDQIVERFGGFHDVLKNKGASAVSEGIAEVLRQWSLEGKLVAQSFDGALLMCQPAGTLQEPIAALYPRALCLHSSSHSLPLCLLHGSKHIRQVKELVAHLEEFDSFFKKSSQRIAYVAQRFLKVTPQSISHWNFRSRGVTTILAHYTEFLTIFEEITVSGWREFDSSTFGQALRLRQVLFDPIFVFLLFLFHEIFYFIDQLTNMLKEESTRSVNTFNIKMKGIINDIRGLRTAETKNKCIMSCLNLNDKLNFNYNNLSSLTYQVIDSQVVHLENRFCDVHQLGFLEIVNEEMFPSYESAGFHDSAVVKQLTEQYSSYFNHDQLKNELWNVYADEGKHLAPEQLLKRFYLNGLEGIYTETTKLLKLALTLPVYRSTGKLKEIKSFLRKCVANDNVSDLDVLAIEKSMLVQLSSDLEFINEVIDVFESLNPSVKLKYKKA